MDPKKFGLPLLSLASLASSACVDPIIGDWECVELNGEDMPYLYEYHYSGTYGDFDYASTLKVSMSIDEDLEGTALVEFEWDAVGTRYLEGYTDHGLSTAEPDVTADVTDDGYDIVLEYDDGTEIEMACELVDQTELECEDDDGGDYVFEKDD